MAAVLQGSILRAGMYLELAQGEPAGVQGGDALRQVSLLLRLFVHDLLLPLLLGLCQHQALRAQADGGGVDGQIPLLRSPEVPVGPRMLTSALLCSAVAEHRGTARGAPRVVLSSPGAPTRGLWGCGCRAGGLGASPTSTQGEGRGDLLYRPQSPHQ